MRGYMALVRPDETRAVEGQPVVHGVVVPEPLGGGNINLRFVADDGQSAHAWNPPPGMYSIGMFIDGELLLRLDDEHIVIDEVAQVLRGDWT